MTSEATTVAIAVNGECHERAVEPRRTLADFLREDLDLTGTHIGCEHGACGACMVLLDGTAVASCTVLAIQAHGCEVTTIEGLSPGGSLNQVMRELRAHHGLQCGFCTPGVVISATAFLRDAPANPSEEDIRAAMAGNLCRCTGYQGIIDAVRAAAAQSVRDNDSGRAGRIDRYLGSTGRAVEWLRGRLQPDGSYQGTRVDLADHYKSPYLFALTGHADDAQRVLGLIARRFMRADGDFVTSAGVKSADPDYDEYWAYPNAWIAIGGHRAGRFDISSRAYEYLVTRHETDSGAFLTQVPGRAERRESDALTTAHVGLLALYLGDAARALAAGRRLARLIEQQPDIGTRLYLRSDENDNVVVAGFPAAQASLYSIAANEPGQAYFMAGYPIAFLTKLFLATGDRSHLATAGEFLSFSVTCREYMFSTHTAHKVAWGASVFGAVTGDPAALALAEELADHLVEIQDSAGSWLAGQPMKTIDQTAEIAIWLTEISAELEQARPLGGASRTSRSIAVNIREHGGGTDV